MDEPVWDEQVLGPRTPLLEALLLSTNEAVTLVRASDSRFVYVNQRACERLGLAPADVIGHAYQEFDFWADEGTAEALAVALLERGSVDGFVAPFRGKDGIMWSEVSVRMVELAGEPHILTSARDLTEYRHAVLQAKQMEVDLEDAEARYRALVEHVPAVTYREIVPKGEYASSTMIYMSPQAERLLGYTSEDFGGDADAFWEAAIHPDDYARVLALSTEAVHGAATYKDEYRLVGRTGEIHWVHDESLFVDTDDDGAQVWHGVMVDVTERRKAEEALRDAEARYRNLIENLPAVVYIDREDPDAELGWSMVYVSPQIEDVLGFSVDAWLSSDLWGARLHPDDAEEALAYDEHAVATGESYSNEYRLMHSDGREVWIHEEASVLTEEGGVRYWQGILTDVTARKSAERDLLERQELMRVVAEASEAFLHTSSWGEPLEGMLRALGDALKAGRMYLFRNAEATGSGLVMSQTHEWVAEGVEPQMGGPHVHDIPFERSEGWALALLRREVVAGPIDELEDADLDDLRAQGVQSLVAVPVFVEDEWWGTLGVDDTNAPRRWRPVEIEALRTAAGMLGTAVRRQEAEEKLRSAEERFRLLVERTPAVVYVDAIDDMSTALYVSPAVEELLGYSPEDRVSTPDLWQRHLHPEDREAVLSESMRTDASGDPFMMDYRMIHTDGHIVWVRDEAVIVRDRHGEPQFRQGVLIDITDRKESEAELERALALERQAAEQLRDLDELKNTFLTAVSHDLRTPLAAVLGLALTLERDDMDLDEVETRDLAGRIAANARKLDRMVVDLLDLDRLSRGVMDPKLSRTDVGFLVRKVVDEAEFLRDHNVVVEADPIVAAVDIGKVERIVENLLANAARHTERGTTVWVRVRAEDEGVLIAIEDAGEGITPELRDAVFEPFRQGEGANTQPSPGVGIGLSLVARFTELHGGRAWVEEREGGGASFRVFLPSPVLVGEDLV